LYIVVRSFKRCSDFFDSPLPSTSLNIFKVLELAELYEVINTDEIPVLLVLGLVLGLVLCLSTKNGVLVLVLGLEAQVLVLVLGLATAGTRTCTWP
jgi:hypothetical protein